MLGAKEPAPQGHREADGTGTDDQHTITWLQLRTAHRVQADGQGLHQGALLETHRIRQAKALAGPHPAELGVGTGQIQGRPHFRPGAMKAASGPARRALAAADPGQGGDTVAPAPAIPGLASHLDHLAGKLVPHHAVGRQNPPAHTGIGILGHVQIGTADTASSDLEDQLAGFGCRVGQLFQYQGRACGFEDGCFHEGYPLGFTRS